MFCIILRDKKDIPFIARQDTFNCQLSFFIVATHTSLHSNNIKQHRRDASLVHPRPNPPDSDRPSSSWAHSIRSVSCLPFSPYTSQSNQPNHQLINLPRFIVIASLQDTWSFSKIVDYMLFAGCWTGFVAVPYLEAAPLWFPRISHELVIPFIEVVTSMIWFSGFIALGVLIPSPSGCVFSTCHALQAVVVLGSVEW